MRSRLSLETIHPNSSRRLRRVYENLHADNVPRMNLPTIKERKRFRSPTVTPQALAWDGKRLWMSSRDLGFLYKVRAGLASSSSAEGADKLEILEEVDPPGIVWA